MAPRWLRLRSWHHRCNLRQRSVSPQPFLLSLTHLLPGVFLPCLSGRWRSRSNRDLYCMPSLPYNSGLAETCRGCFCSVSPAAGGAGAIEICIECPVSPITRGCRKFAALVSCKPSLPDNAGLAGICRLSRRTLRGMRLSPLPAICVQRQRYVVQAIVRSVSDAGG